jgi:hypothetical protein
LSGALTPGRYLVRNIGSGLLLEAYGGAKGSGANVQQWEDTDSPGQWWQLEPVTP